MYTIQVVDVLNGIVKDFVQSPQKREVTLAREMIQGLERNSLCIYDRLHGSYETARGHLERGSLFLVRVRSENPKAQFEIQKFCKSKKRSKWIDLKANNQALQKDPTLPSLRVRLVKVRSPRSQLDLVFMTNLSDKKFTDEEIGELYQRRWEVENSFRDLKSVLKIEQWHSKRLNGILQEIYALLWLVNQMKMQVTKAVKSSCWLKREYSRPNFKLCVEVYLDHLAFLVKGNANEVLRALDDCLQRSQEVRRRLSRNYPRQIRRLGGKYPNVTSVERRP